MKKIYRILESFTYLTDEIVNPLSKPWLKVAIIAHIHHETGYSKHFIRDVVDLIYLSEDI